MTDEINQIVEARMPTFVFGHPNPKADHAGVAAPGTWVDHAKHGFGFFPHTKPLPSTDEATPAPRRTVMEHFRNAVSSSRAFAEKHPRITHLGMAVAGVGLAAMESHAVAKNTPIFTKRYVDPYAKHPNIHRITPTEAREIMTHTSFAPPGVDLARST